MSRSGFATIIKALVDPKELVNNYKLGFRNYYSSPGSILLYGIATITLHLLLVDKTVMNFKVGSADLNAQYGFLIAFYPFLMVISHLAFIRKKINFSVQLISIAYTATSLLIPIIIACDAIYLITGMLFEIEAFWSFVVLNFFWNSRVFTEGNSIWRLLINTLLQLVILSIIVGIVVILNMITN